MGVNRATGRFRFVKIITFPCPRLLKQWPFSKQLNGHSKIDKTKILLTIGSLMKDETNENVFEKNVSQCKNGEDILAVQADDLGR